MFPPSNTTTMAIEKAGYTEECLTHHQRGPRQNRHPRRHYPSHPLRIDHHWPSQESVTQGRLHKPPTAGKKTSQRKLNKSMKAV